MFPCSLPGDPGQRPDVGRQPRIKIYRQLLALVWQFAFFVIATNPVRFRPIIPLAVCEKLSYILAVAALYSAGRVTPQQAATAVPDTLLVILFIIAFLRTPSTQKF